jgi:predicted HTH transcriptional regulator
MKTIPFNPFVKKLEQLESSDLAILKEVAEGWYVEYKSILLDTRKIAKSIAAFANHYGGWL